MVALGSDSYREPNEVRQIMQDEATVTEASFAPENNQKINNQTAGSQEKQTAASVTLEKHVVGVNDDN